MQQQHGPTPPPPQPPGPAGPGGPPPGGPSGGLPQEPGIFGRVMASGYQPDQDEAQNALLAHALGAAFALVTCGALGPLGVVVSMLLAKERKPFFLYHLNQALIFQLAVLVTAIVVGIVTFVLGLLTLGCLSWLLAPVSFAVWIAGVGLPIFVGLGAKDGEWRPYPAVGEKLLHEWKPLLT